MNNINNSYTYYLLLVMANTQCNYRSNSCQIA